MSADQSDALVAALEAHFDIFYDLRGISLVAGWMSENFFRPDIIPAPQRDGYFIDLRLEVLNSLQMRYRGAFDNKLRGGVDQVAVNIVRGDLQKLDRDIIARANNVLAHPIHASSSTTVKMTEQGEFLPYSMRPAANKFDFDNLIALCGRLSPFVASEIERIKGEIIAAGYVPSSDPSHITVYPWGNGTNIAKARTRRDKRPK